MKLISGSDAALLKWKHTLQGDPWRSVHFALAFLFNGLALLYWIEVFVKGRPNLVTRPDLAAAALFVLLLLIVAGLLGWQSYKVAKQHVGERAADKLPEQMIEVSYVAFRLYLLSLGTIFMLLSIARIIIPHC